jgi:hypothetical protein
MTDKITELTVGRVYLDHDDGDEMFICAGTPDFEDQCLVINFDGSYGFAMSRSSDYRYLAESISDYMHDIPNPND